MFDFKILGFEVYYLFFYFFIFSFLGWAMETIKVSLHSKKFINRGFANGPYCPIYGFGMLFVILFLSEFKDNYILLFLGGVILCTALEYFTAYMLELVFKAEWWDYSYKKFNYKGRISLDISIAWGVLSLIMIEYVVPIFYIIINYIPRLVGEIYICITLFIMLTDVVVTIHSLLSLNKVLAKLSAVKLELKEEFTDYMNVLSQNLRERINENTEEFEYRFEAVAKKYIEYKNNLSADLKELFEENNLQSLNEILENINMKERLSNMRDKYQNEFKNNKFNFIQNRIMNAFPKLKYKDMNKDGIKEFLKEYFDNKEE